MGEYFEIVDMNLVDTDVRHSEHGHGGHRGECFTGVTIFQRFMSTAQFCAVLFVVHHILVDPPTPCRLSSQHSTSTYFVYVYWFHQ